MNNRSFGILVLCAYLILVGVASLIAVSIPAWVAGILALSAGVLILIGR
jgi:hypothetical protein